MSTPGETEEMAAHIQRLEWRLRDLGNEHRRLSELVASLTQERDRLRQLEEDLRLLMLDFIDDIREAETIEWAKMRGDAMKWVMEERQK